MGNEFKKCIYKYLNGKIHIINKTNNSIDKYLDLAGRIVYRDNPDGYIKANKNIIILEHFEFDATKNNMKGSENRIQENAFYKKAYSMIENNQDYIQNQYKITISSENLSKNFNKNFNNHIKKINQYKQQLLEEGIVDDDSIVSVVLVAEDKTPLGTFYINKGVQSNLSILNIEECIESITKAPIDGLIGFNQYNDEKWVYIVTPTSIKQFLEKSHPAKDIKMINFQPVEIIINM